MGPLTVLGILGFLTLASLSALPVRGQSLGQDWQVLVRKYAEAGDWDSAMRLVDDQLRRASQDTDVRAWRARVLAWSGRAAEAEEEYRAILEVSPTDPDNWMGLAEVYLREGKIQQARQAIDTAEELSPARPDVRIARAQVLRAAGDPREARLEYQEALKLDPGSAEARNGSASLPHGPRHELRFGQNDDQPNYSAGYRDEWLSLSAQWSSAWTATLAGSFYQRSGTEARKFTGSVTRRQANWGALTVGGAVGHDNAVIPKGEAFFEMDRGWKISEAAFLRGAEFSYTQHWYWYREARVLTLDATTLLYLPRDWTLSLAATGAHSAFSGAGAEWKPAGVGRLGFPLKSWRRTKLSGNMFFGAGAENFAVVDRIGSFSSHTYGGGLRLQVAPGQDVTGFTAYQKRTQAHTDMAFGLSYGIHF